MERLPNTFESYSQPENKLTLALLQTLDADSALSRSFVRWAFPRINLKNERLIVSAQRKPAGGRGLRATDPVVDLTIPDGWLRNDNVVIALEVKREPSLLRRTQLEGHLRCLRRFEATNQALLILTPDETAPTLVEDIRRLGTQDQVEVQWKGWQQVHAWVCEQYEERGGGQGDLRGFFLRQLREYLEMSEVSGFAGFVFDGEYDVRRARALLKALRNPLQAKMRDAYPALEYGRERLMAEGDIVWDVFAAHPNFTLVPHFTFSIHPEGPGISLTIPDKANSAWKNLTRLARERDQLERALRESLRLMLSVPRPLRPAVSMALMQRHWENRNRPVTDAEIVVRLDSTSMCPKSLQSRGAKREEGWYEACVRLLAGGKGRANWEFQIRSRFDLSQKIVGQPSLSDEFARIAKGFKPIYSLMT